ncbi:MAG: hypothetical protein KGL77_05500 [Actinomycetales bacterium]|nr:hypothetical protein [Actinomycetales bacterium]
MIRWINKLLGRKDNASATRHEVFDALTPREQEILRRELADSARNAMGDPGDSLSGATGIFGTRTATKIGLNQSARIDNGSVPNVGRLTEEL